MPRPRKRRPPAPSAVAPPPTPAAPRRCGEPELLASAAVLLVLLHTWLARTALNPDGVSYLDLANRAAAGDWPAFVQGYWSPLYPGALALVVRLTGHAGAAMVADAHILNGVVTIAAIVLLWWWSRQLARPFIARALLAAFLLISSGLPRIEAVTPDTLLLALLAWIGYELLHHRGERPVRAGLLLGAAYLIKTSAWPWLLLTVPLRLWGAPNPAARRAVLISSGVGALVMLLWIVPLSVEAGHPTLGSAGRLNYAWYIESSDARTPDTHTGRHASYAVFPADSTHRVGWVAFPDADRWTYAPWSDPTGWQAGVLTQSSHPPSAGELLRYWGRQARWSFGLWLLPVLLGILCPFYLLSRPANLRRHLWQEDRPVLVVVLLGLAGVGQFILVHAEPRLIAPFGLLFALALLHEFALAPPREAPLLPVAVRQLGSVLGLLLAAGYAVPRIGEGFASSARIGNVLTAIASTNASLAQQGLTPERIVILGPAMPVTASAFLAGAHIVAQVPPQSLDVLKHLPPERQRSTLTTLFAGRARIAWVTTPEAGVSIVVIPPK